MTIPAAHRSLAPRLRHRGPVALAAALGLLMATAVVGIPAAAADSAVLPDIAITNVDEPDPAETCGPLDELALSPAVESPTTAGGYAAEPADDPQKPAPKTTTTETTTYCYVRLITGGSVEGTMVATETVAADGTITRNCTLKMVMRDPNGTVIARVEHSVKSCTRP